MIARFLSGRRRQWSPCRVLRGSGICRLFKQILPTGKKSYGELDGPFGWIISADGTDGYTVALLKWIGNQFNVFAIQINVLAHDVAKLLDS